MHTTISSNECDSTIEIYDNTISMSTKFKMLTAMQEQIVSQLRTDKHNLLSDKNELIQTLDKTLQELQEVKDNNSILVKYVLELSSAKFPVPASDNETDSLKRQLVKVSEQLELLQEANHTLQSRNLELQEECFELKQKEDISDGNTKELKHQICQLTDKNTYLNGTLDQYKLELYHSTKKILKLEQSLQEFNEPWTLLFLNDIEKLRLEHTQLKEQVLQLQERQVHLVHYNHTLLEQVQMCHSQNQNEPELESIEQIHEEHICISRSENLVEQRLSNHHKNTLPVFARPKIVAARKKQHREACSSLPSVIDQLVLNNSIMV
jgi:chromosome segregation ATPase